MQNLLKAIATIQEYVTSNHDFEVVMQEFQLKLDKMVYDSRVKKNLREDIYSELKVYLFTLIKKLNTSKFNSDSEIKKYVHTCLEHELTKTIKIFSKFDVESFFEDLKYQFSDTSIVDPSENSKLNFKALIDPLSSKQQKILTLNLYNNLSLTKISTLTNFSISYISQEKKRALIKLRQLNIQI